MTKRDNREGTILGTMKWLIVVTLVCLVFIATGGHALAYASGRWAWW